MTRWPLGFALVLGGSLVLTGCASQQSPTAPASSLAGGAIAAGTELTADQAAVPADANAAIRGQVNLLNLDRGTFMVVPPSGGREKARWIKVDPRTVIWTFNGTTRTRLRLTALANGMVVNVHGIERDRFILALNIAVNVRR